MFIIGATSIAVRSRCNGQHWRNSILGSAKERQGLMLSRAMAGIVSLAESMPFAVTAMDFVAGD